MTVHIRRRDRIQPMATNVLTIEYTDDLLRRTGLSRENFDREARFLLAAKLYEVGRLSSGEAASLLGMERVEFLLSLSKHGIPMSNLTLADLEDDLNFALNG